MSEILARIRVRETHGIRRFLYPLMARVEIPPQPGTMAALAANQEGRYTKESADFFAALTASFRLLTQNGQPIPFYLSNYGGSIDVPMLDLDFAVSLGPFSEMLLQLTRYGEEAPISDPLRLSQGAQGELQNVQERFTLVANDDGGIDSVVYDGLPHLDGSSSVTRKTETAMMSSGVLSPLASLLSASVRAKGRYADACQAETLTGITACKSWATVTHRLGQPKPGDEIVFTLPLAITSPTLTCDFGVGGYVFGRLDAKAPEIVWRTEFGDAPHARWTVATAGRTDYVGEVETAETFLPQRWFHLIDSDKALAVAITQVPPDCREMTVRLTYEGDVTVAFRLGEAITGPAAFGVCYHFLNDVPAIAAATNPQSILLPLVVEVLPV